MPYCSQCGNQVRDLDAYCTKCGAKQPIAAAGPLQTASEAVSDRTSCVLCYIPFIGWVVSIIVLASARFRDNRIVRFHAFQGLYLFVAWLVADRVLAPILHLTFIPFSWGSDIGWGLRYGWGGIASLVELVIILVGIFMMFKVNDREALKIPVLGELADKSL